LSKKISQFSYLDLTVFIDPIDGTREFSTGLGEQCSICIGFANIKGQSIAGLVYRPVTNPPTWAAGAPSEGYAAGRLNRAKTSNNKGLLTSNGGISPFIEELLKQGSLERVKAGGAGNKVLMLLEGKGGIYLQDRGVSRWDTCGAESVLEAHGGQLFKLSSVTHPSASVTETKEETKEGTKEGGNNKYTYLVTDTNLDFIPSLPSLTRYNASASAQPVISAAPKGTKVQAEVVDQVLPYANLCGLFAVNSAAGGHGDLAKLVDTVRKTVGIVPPAFD